MCPIPNQALTVADPGLNVVDASPTAPLIMGVSSTGTNYELNTYSRKPDVIAEYGQGTMPEAACKILDIAGGPVHCMKLDGTVAGAAGAVTAVPGGAATGTITVAGAAFDAYEVIVEILTTGAAGVATFRYSLDDGNTYSGELIVPTGLSTVIANTNLTITWVPGGGPIIFEDGDVHWFNCTAPYYSATELALGAAAGLALTTEYPFIVLTGTAATAAGGATMFAGVVTQAAAYAAVNRYTRWIMDVGTDTTANVVTSWETLSDRRIMPCYSTTDVGSSKPFVGWSVPARPSMEIIAAVAANSLISTDLARVATGPLPGVIAVGHDEDLNEVLDVHRISTTRSLIGRSGFFCTNGRLISPDGSDFRYWQHGRIMDTACRTTFLQQQNFLSIGLRTNADGTIDERDATRLEAIVNSALREQLTQPSNAEGTPGHVSDLSYRIDRTVSIIATETLRSQVSIRPLGYAKQIVTTLGFSLEV